MNRFTMNDGLFELIEITPLIITYGMRTYVRNLLKIEMKEKAFKRFFDLLQ